MWWLGLFRRGSRTVEFATGRSLRDAHRNAHRNAHRFITGYSVSERAVEGRAARARLDGLGEFCLDAVGDAG
jgi:hypothetical protein